MADFPQPGLPQQDQATHILRTVFGYDRFRPPQDEVVAHLIAGGDALVLMPTGGGKSLCYQIPALVRAGTGIVVSPLIALMQDQVSALRQNGVRAAFLNSSLTRREARRVEAQLARAASWSCSTSRRSGCCRTARSTCSSTRTPASRSSRSTRPTASPSGDTTSGRSTCSSTSSRRALPGRAAPRLHGHGRRRARAAEIVERLALADAASSSPASTGRTSATGWCQERNPRRQLLALLRERACRRRRHRLLPVAQAGRGDRGVPRRARASRRCPTTPARRRTCGRATRRASCARTAW